MDSVLSEQQSVLTTLQLSRDRLYDDVSKKHQTQEMLAQRSHAEEVKLLKVRSTEFYKPLGRPRITIR